MLVNRSIIRKRCISLSAMDLHLEISYNVHESVVYELAERYRFPGSRTLAFDCRYVATEEFPVRPKNFENKPQKTSALFTPERIFFQIF